MRSFALPNLTHNREGEWSKKISNFPKNVPAKHIHPVITARSMSRLSVE